MTESQQHAGPALIGSATRRVAVLDMNNGEPNLGLGAIVDCVETFASSWSEATVKIEIFDVRRAGEVPGNIYDVYISSGGPGSPFDGEGKPWEAAYFDWLDSAHSRGAPTLLICHSYEMMIRHFRLAKVTRRRSPSFGIYPVHPTETAQNDPVMHAVDDPFYVADFRNWQAVEADAGRFAELDAEILAREKIRRNEALERAIMAVRIGRNMLGVQFHPEASPEGMALHFLKDDRIKNVVEKHGADTLERLLKRLKRPEALARTHATIIPRFLHDAFEK